MEEIGGGGSRRNGMGGSIAEVGRGGRERTVDVAKDDSFRMLSAYANRCVLCHNTRLCSDPD